MLLNLNDRDILTVKFRPILDVNRLPSPVILRDVQRTMKSLHRYWIKLEGEHHSLLAWIERKRRPLEKHRLGRP
jgi:hypothetical protein